MGKVIITKSTDENVCLSVKEDKKDKLCKHNTSHTFNVDDRKIRF